MNQELTKVQTWTPSKNVNPACHTEATANSGFLASRPVFSGKDDHHKNNNNKHNKQSNSSSLSKNGSSSSSPLLSEQ